MEKGTKKKSNWLLWVLLVIFPPVGIPYMWIAKKEFPSSKKKILSVVSAIWFIIILATGGNDTNSDIPDESANVSLDADDKADKPADSDDVADNTQQPPESDEPSNQTEQTPESDEKEQAPEEPEPSNILIASTVQTSDVKSGAGNNKIGTRAYIEISKEDLKTVTAEEYTEFSETVVSDSGYNWFSIICDDGTGICYAGCIISIAEYGELDAEGCITNVTGYISITDGKCSYEEKSDDVSLEESSDASAKNDASGDGSNFHTYDNEEQQQTTETYVLNTNTRKFHYPSCSSVSQIAPQNYSTSSSSREELIAQGYDPCGRCNP